MYFILLPLFIIVPILELWLLFNVATQIGFLATFLLVFLTALLGVYLLRQQGMETFMRLRGKVAASQLPVQELAEGLLLFFAGGLLLTPGLVTDGIGFFLMLPWGRKAVAGLMGSIVKSQIPFADMIFPDSDSTQSSHTINTSRESKTTKTNNVIEGEYEDISKS